MDQNLIREKIRRILKEKGLSIRKAERLCGLGPTVLRSFLLGKSQNPKIETLRAFAKVLGIEVSELMEIPNLITEKVNSLPFKGKLFIELCSVLVSLLEHENKYMTNSNAFSILMELYYTFYEKDQATFDKDILNLFFKNFLNQNSKFI